MLLARALSCFLLLSVCSGFAQKTEVSVGSLLLTKEPAGWRVSFHTGVSPKYGLRGGDLLTQIDSQSAAELGPFAALAAFNAAFVRSVPLLVERGNQKIESPLWRSDGPAPPERLSKNGFVSTSAEAPDFTLSHTGRCSRKTLRATRQMGPHQLLGHMVCALRT
jgi:hypothetical protein